MLVTISAGDIHDFQGTGTPTTARLYANHQFTDSDGDIVAFGSPSKPNFYQEFTASLVGGALRIATGDAFSTTDSDTPGATYTLVAYNEKGRAIWTHPTKLRIPPAPTPTTWQAIKTYSQARTLRDAPTYLSTQELYALFATWIDRYQKASDVLQGTVRLSEAAEVLSDPVAVGNNDSMIRAMRQSVYLERYGHDRTGLLAAISAIGDDVRALVITDELPINTGVINIPDNILVVFEGQGSITVASTRSVTINALAPPTKRVFFGLGSVLVHSPILHLVWWTGLETSGDDSHAFAQVVTSLTEMGGGTVHIGTGPWHCRTIVWPPFTRVIGSGNAVDGFDSDEGTVIMPPEDLIDKTDGELDALTIPIPSRFVWGVQEAFRMNSFENVCLSSATSGLFIPFYAKGANPNTGLGLTFRNVSFDGNDAPADSVPRFQIHTTNEAQWECGNVLFDHCFWSVPEDSYGWDCDTVNNINTFISCELVCQKGATGIHGTNIGYTEIISTEFRGTLGDRDDVDLTSRTQTNTIITDGGFSNFTAGSLDTWGAYVPYGTANGKTSYVVSGTDPTANGCYWNGSAWLIRKSSATKYSSTNNTTYPWQATFSVGTGTSPAPTLTGNAYLDITGGGQFQDADKGQKAIRNGVTAYIKGLQVVAATGLASRATLSDNVVPDAVSRSTAIWRAGPNPLQAYAGVDIDGSHTTLTMRGCVSEGFQYMAVFAGQQLEGPFNFDGCWIQDRILVNGSCEIALRGNHTLSQIIVEGNSDALVRVTSSGDSISRTSKNYYNGTSVVYLDEAQLWGPRVGVTSYVQSEDSFPESSFRSKRENPLAVYDRSNSATPSNALFEAGSGRLTGSGLPQPLFAGGRLHPVLPDVLDKWYRQGYHYNSGQWWHWSNVNVPYRKYRYDAPVQAPAFQTTVAPNPGGTGGDDVPLALDDNDNIASVQIITSGGGWIPINGFTFPAATEDLDDPDYEGLEVEFVFSGGATDGVTLTHLGGTSEIDNKCDCGFSINLSDGERARGKFHDGVWNISKISPHIKIFHLESDVTYNNTASLATTPLALNVGPGCYEVEARIQSTSVAKSLQLDLAGGGATKASFVGKWDVAAATVTAVAAASVSSAATAFSAAGVDTLAAAYTFKGGMVISAGGLVSLRGAQRTAAGSDTKILALSMLKITPVKVVS